MKIQSLSSGGFWLTAVLVSVAAVLILSAAVAMPLQASDWWAGWRPVMFAVMAACLIPPIGLMPLLWADRSKPVKLAQATQLASALRLGTAAVLALLFLLALSPGRPRIVVGVWIAGLYVVTLVVEMSVRVVWL
ncbi:MAG TPA: hypothetical protein VHP11_12205, partial [Tepidisphaeraceae bacterium]|nr:hypothetical protein [Tepidisphaeraceae bacterium]